MTCRAAGAGRTSLAENTTGGSAGSKMRPGRPFFRAGSRVFYTTGIAPACRGIVRHGCETRGGACLASKDLLSWRCVSRGVPDFNVTTGAVRWPPNGRPSWGLPSTSPVERGASPCSAPYRGHGGRRPPPTIGLRAPRPVTGAGGPHAPEGRSFTMAAQTGRGNSGGVLVRTRPSSFTFDTWPAHIGLGSL